MWPFMTACRSSAGARYHSVDFTNGYTTRYLDRSPLKRLCSWVVGRFTYWLGRVMPIIDSEGIIQRPMPALSRSAAVSSTSSIRSAMRHSSSSPSARRPMVE
jgi:hypothetical protein